MTKYLLRTEDRTYYDIVKLLGKETVMSTKFKDSACIILETELDSKIRKLKEEGIIVFPVALPPISEKKANSLKKNYAGGWRVK